LSADSSGNRGDKIMVSWLFAVAAFYFILLPAVCVGALALLTYHAATKIRPAAGRLLPIATGLLLSVLAPVAGPFSLLVDGGVMAMGVLTPFIFVERYVPARHRYEILFLGSVLAVPGRMIYGIATIANGGAGSPLFQMLTSLSSSDAGFLILNSVALYLETALISALVFGVLLAATAAFRKLRKKE